MSNSTKSCHLSLLKTKPLNREGSPEIVGHELPPKVFEMIFLPAVNDEIKNELLTFLRWSVSLDYDEKLQVIDSMPTLTAFQVESLISVFNEENLTFAELKDDFGNENIIPGNEGCKLYLDVISRRDSDWVELKKTLLRRLLSE